jgi:arsenite methyltransferase
MAFSTGAGSLSRGDAVKPTESSMSYFDLQAYIGTTKHMGGFASTRQLLERCRIAAGSCVLDVGCGVGATTCYLAKTYGCRVVGVDLRESMVGLSSERARKEGVRDLVEFRVADAQDLPFEDATFGVVLCESVATFVRDRQRVANELVRVVRAGGRVGLNEEVWLKAPPDEIVWFVKRTWDIELGVPTREQWVEMLERAGLFDLEVETFRVDPRRESTQIKRYRLEDMLRMFYRILVLYVKSATFRGYMAERKRVPRGLFEHLGYAVMVGSK